MGSRHEFRWNGKGSHDVTRRRIPKYYDCDYLEVKHQARMVVLQVYKNKVQEALLPDWIICQYSFNANDDDEILTRCDKKERWLCLRDFDRRPAPGYIL